MQNESLDLACSQPVNFRLNEAFEYGFSPSGLDCHDMLGNVTGTVVTNGWDNSLTLGNNRFSSVVVTTPVPEPDSYALMMLGLAVVIGARRLKRVN